MKSLVIALILMFTAAVGMFITAFYHEYAMMVFMLFILLMSARIVSLDETK